LCQGRMTNVQMEMECLTVQIEYYALNQETTFDYRMNLIVGFFA
jgi:hypothetical protein